MAVTVAWPDTLPLPTFEGYKIEPMDSILRTEMESGPARQRRRYTQTPTRIPVRWRFTAWQFALFESWFKHRAKEGGEWFSISLLGGLGIAGHEARFVGRGGLPYRAKPLRGGPGKGARWIVTSTVEIRGRPTLTDESLEVFLVEDPEGLLGAIDELHAVVHGVFPSEQGWSLFSDNQGVLMAASAFNTTVHCVLPGASGWN